ncbi:MAG: RND family efflux transporter MFP subunit [Myxococcota bacterium]|jgi:RND family efflux transporter MFP subunit
MGSGPEHGEIADSPDEDAPAMEDNYITSSGAGMWGLVALLAIGIGVVWLMLPDGKPAAAGEVVRPPVPVTVIDVPRGIVREALRSEGTLQAVRREFLSFEATGRVLSVARAEDGSELRPGSRVKGPVDGELGQLLASVDARDQSEDIVLEQVGVKQREQDVKTQSAQVSQARSDLNLTRATLARIEGLYKVGDTSLAKVQEAKAKVKAAEATLRARRASLNSGKAGITGAQARLGKAEVRASRAELRAPFDGEIARINVRQGDYITASQVDRSSEARQLATAPVTVIDPGEFEALVEVPAFDARRIKAGQLAAIIDAREELRPPEEGTNIADLPLSIGQVFSVARAVDSDSRTVVVRVRTRHNVSELRHGQFVTVIIVVDQAEDALVAPLDTIIFRDGKAFCFVVNPETMTAERRELTFGVRGVRTYEVTEGLREGDQVITAGRFRVTQGASVSITRKDTADIGWQGRPPKQLLESGD